MKFKLEKVQDKNIYVFADSTKSAIISLLESLSNLFYKPEVKKHNYNFVSLTSPNEPNIVLKQFEKDIHIYLTNEYSVNYYNDQLCSINLSMPLMTALAKQNLPSLCVFYHELGHYIFSKRLFKYIEFLRAFLERYNNINKNINISNNTTKYEPYENYLHLLNWIDDFYIEEQMQKYYPYTKDMFNCLYKMNTEFNELEIQYAFHYYYKHKQASPTLSAEDQKQFIIYINKLLTYRNDNKFACSKMQIFSTTYNIMNQFTTTLNDFYKWCVNKGIFPKHKSLPIQPLPIVLVIDAAQHNNTPTNNTNNIDDVVTIKTNKRNDSTKYSDTLVGITPKKDYKIVLPKCTNVNDFIKQTTLEQEQISNIEQRLLDIDSDNKNINMSVLFSKPKYTTAIQQAHVCIKNFFNPNKIAQRLLFLETHALFSNVSIYRDISASVNNNEFKLMDQIIQTLYNNIPITPEFYLYSSGKYAIVKCPYISWTNPNNKPEQYKTNILINSMGKGTDSNAIAQIIEKQFNDHWLNIIVTDGDLDSLYARNNINKLLSNVFIIFVCNNITMTIDNFTDKYKIPDHHYILIRNNNDVEKINNAIIKCFIN